MNLINVEVINGVTITVGAAAIIGIVALVAKVSKKFSGLPEALARITRIMRHVIMVQDYHTDALITLTDCKKSKSKAVSDTLGKMEKVKAKSRRLFSSIALDPDKEEEDETK